MNDRKMNYKKKFENKREKKKHSKKVGGEKKDKRGV